MAAPGGGASSHARLVPLSFPEELQLTAASMMSNDTGRGRMELRFQVHLVQSRTVVAREDRRNCEPPPLGMQALLHYLRGLTLSSARP